MSKIVKKVGKAVGKVFKGVKKAASSAWKKVKKSKVLKALAIAAAVFVGAPMLMGALGGASAGFAGASGGLFGKIGAAMQGAWTGGSAAFSNAIGGISSAWGSALQGNFGQAASQLGGNLTGNFAAGQQAVSGLGNIGTAMAGGGSAPIAGQGGQSWATGNATTQSLATPQAKLNSMFGGQQVSLPGATPIGQAAQSATQQAGQSLFSRMVSSPYTAPALLMTGGNMLSGYAQARAAEEQDKQQRERYNINVGSPVFIPRF